MDGRYILKEFQRLLHGHIQHIVDAFAFVFDFKRLTVITLSAADLTRHIHIRQEVHLNLKDSVTAAGFASSALDVETESSLLISAGLGIRCRCKQITDHVKHTGVSCRIGTRRTTDR